IGILMAIAVPNFIRSRETARHNACINNLRQIDTAKEQWAMDNKMASGAACQMSDLALSYLKFNAAGPQCPSGGVYTVNPISTNPACSLSGPPDNHFLP